MRMQHLHCVMNGGDISYHNNTHTQACVARSVKSSGLSMSNNNSLSKRRWLFKMLLTKHFMKVCWCTWHSEDKVDVSSEGGAGEKQIRGFECSTYINKQWEALGFQLKYKQAKVLAEYSNERPEKQYDCKRRVQSECFSVVWPTLNMQRQKPKVNEDWIYIRPEPLQKDCCL